jgi:hypothetical protein
LKLEALLERVYFSTNEKRAGADYTFQPMRREQEQIINHDRIEPVLTGVEVLKLKALLERVLFNQ